MSVDVDSFSAIVETSAKRRAFGYQVRAKRALLEMDQYELAEKASCLLHQVQQVEAGTCYLSGVLRRVAEVLSIDAGKVAS